MKLQLPKTKLQVLKTKSNLKYFCPVAGKLAQINKSKGCRHFNLNRDVHRYIFCFHLDCSSENLIIACPVRLQLSSFPTLNVHRYIFCFHLDCSSENLIIACPVQLQLSSFPTLNVHRYISPISSNRRPFSLSSNPHPLQWISKRIHTISC